MPLVIFVDDSETALASIRMVTANMPITTKQYLNAKNALNDIINGDIPDLIITDMNMPIMNGLEFLKQIRLNKTTSKTPVLMLTTETNIQLKEQAKALGVTGWIVKPFNPSQLKQALSRVLRLEL